MRKTHIFWFRTNVLLLNSYLIKRSSFKTKVWKSKFGLLSLRNGRLSLFMSSKGRDLCESWYSVISSISHTQTHQDYTQHIQSCRRASSMWRYVPNTCRERRQDKSALHFSSLGPRCGMLWEQNSFMIQYITLHCGIQHFIKRGLLYAAHFWKCNSFVGVIMISAMKLKFIQCVDIISSETGSQGGTYQAAHPLF